MKSRKMKHFAALLLAFVMCMSLLAGCGSDSDTDETSDAASEESTDAESTEQEDVSIAIGSTYSRIIGVFDSTGYANDQVNVSATYLAFDVTFYRNPSTREWTTDIFEEYYVTDDQTELVLVLRDGIYFASGDQMIGEDVLWTFTRQSQVSRSMGDWEFVDLTTAEVSDDGLTITIPIVTYRGDWMTVLSGIAIMNESWIEENGGDDFDYTDPSLVDGSGPYEVTEYVADISCTYVKRDDWWQEGEDETVAQAAEITCYYYSESTTMMVDYENGVIDACLNISADNYSEVAADESLGTAALASSNTVATFWFNVDYSEAAADENLRLAMAYGTNAEDIAIAAYGDLGTVASGTISSTLSEFFADGYAYEYDPEKAMEIIEEYGLEGTELTMITTSGINATIAEVWQAQMAEIGIDLTIEVYDEATCVTLWLQTDANDVQLLGGNTEDENGDPTTTFNTVSNTGDFPALAKLDETFNELLDIAKNGSTTEERAEAYLDVYEYLYETVYAIPVAEWYNAYCYGASGKITNMDLYVVTNTTLRYIQVY